MAPAYEDLAYDTLQIEREGAIEWLTLNRPERLNALSRQMCDELQAYFGHLYTDHHVRVVILRGAGRGFCAGFDLKDAGDFSAGPTDGMRAQRRVSEVILRMRRCPQPIIALLNGPASGGGFALALASDVRYATPKTRMNVAMAKVGLTGCDMGISYFLPKTVGVSVAAELMMSGRFIDAERSRSLGLVSDVVAPENLAATGRQLAQEMLSLSPLGLRMTKEGLNAALSAGSLEQVIALEDRGQILCASAGHFDEGIAAFIEKRDPVYTEE
ncbi:MAG: enoyl-CoA hydratase [Candidatus Entotheonella gemina]|uniref:Enoyl-CoA hydratase n=1 Tax=Candidatus Entotheonella gemina TaxID=1429439 RepID=W4M401_9BACT|nr:MAG: enoyl-CoA hydratase [Candidatus Entotheonella gemina]